MNKFISCLLLIVTVLLSGCTTFLIDGHANSTRSATAQHQDNAITSNIKMALIRDKQIDSFNITVTTYHGVVTLHGYVKNSSQLSRSIQLARPVSGVKRVVSKLTIN